MITITLATALSSVALMLTVACTTAGVVLLRQQRRLSARCLAADASLAALQRELQVTATAVATLSSRMQGAPRDPALREPVGRDPIARDPIDMRGAAQSFDMAIDFARRGGDAAQLVQRFGMSRGEAELTIRMHGAKRSA